MRKPKPRPRRKALQGFWLWLLITLASVGSVVLLSFMRAAWRLFGI